MHPKNAESQFRQIKFIVLAMALILAPLLMSTLYMSDAPDAGAKGSPDDSYLSLLTPAPAHAAKADTNKSTAKGKDPSKWTCPMHPHYIATEYGACPICGMDLVKLDTGGMAGGESSSEARATVSVSPEVMQSMGVRLAKVERPVFGRGVKSFGIIRENERLRSDITARVEGWVEKLLVTAVGDEVKKGAPIFELYSPRLIVSQNDYLGGGERRGLAQLRSFGVQKQALDLIKDREKPLQKVPFFAEQTGTVSMLNLNQGTYVKRGMMLARIQSYKSVWLIVSVFEKDLSLITTKTEAEVSFPNLPGRKAKARVDYIYPTIDSKTRTGQVRLVLDNPDGLFRPGSYADVTFAVASKKRLAIPSEAVLRSEEGRYVVVSLGKGNFEPRAVELGLVSGRWWEVTGGLKEGEDIVVSGQFMIDSESALRESFRKLERLQLPLSLLTLTKTEFAMIDHMVDASLYLHEALIDGYDIDGKFLEPAIAIRELLWPRYKNTKLAFVLNDAVAALKQAQAARTEREVQEALAILNAALRSWVLQGAPEHYKTRKISLFKEQRGARMWICNWLAKASILMAEAQGP